MANDDDERDPAGGPAAAPSDGVRILGAEPATGAGRAVHWSDEGPSWSATDEPVEAQIADLDEETSAMALPVIDSAEDATDEAPELPHWSEPPTGAMPAIFDQDGRGEGDDWSTLSDPQSRFRSGDRDWEGGDFAEQLAEATADDPELQGGALGEPEADSDEEFAAAVAQRRSGRREVQAPRRAAPAPSAGTTPKPSASRPDLFGDAAGGRNVPVALLTAGFLGLVAIVCFLAGEGFTALLAAAILGAAATELVGTLHRKNLRTAHLVVIAGSVAAPLAAWSEGVYGFVVVVGLVVVTTMLWFLFEAGPGRPLIGSAMTLFAFAWVGGLGGFAGLLLNANDGVEWLLAALLPTIAYDVFGFFVGQQFGKSPIAPRISPNKTIEGTAVGVLASVVIGAAVIVLLDPFESHASWAVLVGLGAGIAALFGDLCESMIKRDLGIKDFSGSLPGHGGVLDRFDGLLFAMPVVFFLMIHFPN